MGAAGVLCRGLIPSLVMSGDYGSGSWCNPPPSLSEVLDGEGLVPWDGTCSACRCCRLCSAARCEDRLVTSGSGDTCL